MERRRVGAFNCVTVEGGGMRPRSVLARLASPLRRRFGRLGRTEFVAPVASVALLALAALALVAVLASAFARSHRSARDVPLSPLSGDWVVGPDYVDRDALGDGTEPVGEMDDFAAYARPDFDPNDVSPEIKRFYERTGEYDLAYRVRWHRGFRLGAALAARATTRLQQLNLPGPGDESWHRLRSRFVGIDDAADPRTDARAWIRTDPETGEAVFVAVYATHERDGETYNNIAVPLPRSNLSTVLRMNPLGEGETGEQDGPGEAGVELTTVGDGDPGLYLATPLGAFALPMDQRFRVRSADAASTASELAVPPVDGANATEATPELVATHEMWLCGAQFLTVEYVIGRRAET